MPVRGGGAFAYAAARATGEGPSVHTIGAAAVSTDASLRTARPKRWVVQMTDMTRLNIQESWRHRVPLPPSASGLSSRQKGSIGFSNGGGAAGTFDFPVLRGCCGVTVLSTGTLSTVAPGTDPPLRVRRAVGSSTTPRCSPRQPRSSQDAAAYPPTEIIWGQLRAAVVPPLHPSPDTLPIRHHHALLCSPPCFLAGWHLRSHNNDGQRSVPSPLPDHGLCPHRRGAAAGCARPPRLRGQRVWWPAFPAGGGLRCGGVRP